VEHSSREGEKIIERHCLVIRSSKAVHQYKLLDTSAEKVFDDLTCLTAHIAGLNCSDKSFKYKPAMVQIEGGFQTETLQNVAFLPMPVTN